MNCKSYPLEPGCIKEYEVFSGGIGNIAFDYVYTEDSRHPLGFLDLPQCKRVVTLIRKQIKKLHKLDHLPPTPLPKEDNFADAGQFVPFAGVVQDRLQEIKVEKQD